MRLGSANESEGCAQQSDKQAFSHVYFKCFVIVIIVVNVM